jgi:hypothetical protein
MELQCDMQWGCRSQDVTSWMSRISQFVVLVRDEHDFNCVMRRVPGDANDLLMLTIYICTNWWWMCFSG